MSNVNTDKFYSKITLDGIKNIILDKETYLYIADGLNTANSSTNLVGSTKDVKQATRQILIGKKIQESNIFPMVRRIDWEPRVFDEYTDSEDLSNKDFYVINSNHSVYKCIYNNNGATSVVEPTTNDIHPTTTADGYIWKYMYSITEREYRDYCTNDLIVVFNDGLVQAAAIPGTVDRVIIKSPGADYVTNAGFIASIISNTTFRISDSADPGNGRYNKSFFYISEGDGVGQIGEILSYTANTIGKFVQIDTELDDISPSSKYIISPGVKITGDGTGAIFRTVLDTAGRINSVLVVGAGNNYTVASAAVSANSIYGSGGTVEPIISPVTGHGFDPATELQARHLLVTMKLDGDELGTVPTDISFTKYGLISGAVDFGANTEYAGNTFTNTVEIEYSSVIGNFSKGDNISVGEVNIQVVKANTSILRGVYTSNEVLTTNGVNFTSSTGAQGVINDFVQPEVELKRAEIYVLNTVDSIQRNTDESEIINIIIKC